MPFDIFRAAGGTYSALTGAPNPYTVAVQNRRNKERLTALAIAGAALVGGYFIYKKVTS